jgi:Zn-dependent protease
MMHAALSFVLVVRSAVLSVYAGIVDILPWNTEPAYGPFQLSRWSRFKFNIRQKTIPKLPEWIEYRGNYMFLVKTTKGKDKLDWVVDRIPKPLFNVWQRFGVSVMVILLVLHSLLILAAIGVSVVAMGIALQDLVTNGLPLDLLAVETGQTEVERGISLQDVLWSLATIPIAIGILLLLSAVFWYLLVLPLLPGLLLHEFGHYAMAKRADVEIQSYGFIFMGPFVQGAFVEPNDEDLERASVSEKLRILSGGVGTNILLATGYICLALLVLENPVNAFSQVLTGNAYLLADQPVALCIVGLACVEVALALLNTLPGGEIDGGRVVQIVEEEFNQT